MRLGGFHIGYPLSLSEPDVRLFTYSEGSQLPYCEHLYRTLVEGTGVTGQQPMREYLGPAKSLISELRSRSSPSGALRK